MKITGMETIPVGAPLRDAMNGKRIAPIQNQDGRTNFNATNVGQTVTKPMIGLQGTC